MFSYIAGQPLAGYIRSRQLTLAAFDLLNTEATVLEISLRYGYSSPDSFTRAFQKFHKVLPSTVRNDSVQLQAYPRLSFQMTIKG